MLGCAPLSSARLTSSSRRQDRTTSSASAAGTGVCWSTGTPHVWAPHAETLRGPGFRCYGRGTKRRVAYWTLGVVGVFFGTTRGSSRPRPGISRAAAADERPDDPAFATVIGRQACASQTPLMCAQ